MKIKPVKMDCILEHCPKFNKIVIAYSNECVLLVLNEFININTK